MGWVLIANPLLIPNLLHLPPARISRPLKAALPGGSGDSQRGPQKQCRSRLECHQLIWSVG